MYQETPFSVAQANSDVMNALGDLAENSGNVPHSFQLFRTI